MTATIAQSLPLAEEAPLSRLPVAVRLWLAVIALMVVAMVVVGGATRLTGSGLSITEWQPILGALPPLSDADWQAAFARYRTIPQFSVINPGMTLGEFQFIYWWEWAHRLLGRAIGVVFVVPFAVFWLRGDIPRREVPALLGLFALGGFQGAIGWWMVASGLTERTEVAPYRLAIHLTMAILIFMAAVWLAARNARRAPEATSSRIRTGATVVLGATVVQAFLGALVAGNNAGLLYNSWPLMDGRWFPAEALSLSPMWHNFFENHAMVQFLHRMGAYAVFVLVVLHGFRIAASGRCDILRVSALVMILTVVAQAGLGIATLLLQVPLWLALAHQLMAMVLIGITVIHRARIQ